MLSQELEFCLNDAFAKARIEDIDTAALTRTLVEHGAILEYAPTIQGTLVSRFRGRWPPPAPKQ